MLGKSLSKNLSAYFSTLSGLSGTSIYLHDSNQERLLPNITIGFESEEMSFKGGYGHYTVKGFTNVTFQGYEDRDNTSADQIADILVSALGSDSLYTYVNAPTGTDSRPAKNFCLNALFIRSVNREEDGLSTLINISYDAFTAAKD